MSPVPLQICFLRFSDEINCCNLFERGDASDCRSYKIFRSAPDNLVILCLGSHVTNFEDYGYTFICHMGNEDRKVLMENVSAIPRDNEKKIEIHGGAGELGIKVFKGAQWKIKCKRYFNRYFKTSTIISVPSDEDMIMNTLSSMCSDNKSRGFVFKNYDIAKHLEFLGYDKVALKEKLGVALTNKSISYIAYIEQANVIFICEKVSNGSNIDKCLENIAVMVKYFLILYDKEIRASGVTVVGLLIRGNEKQEFVECKFCHLFSPSFKDFESAISFENWWVPVENYEGWWNLANPGKQKRLFDDLAAEILCFMAVQEKGLPIFTDDKSQQFRQTYFLYTPQQMNIHFSDAKHVVIQGSYGSGKSLLGLKKLELIFNSLGRNEKIIYVNFDSKSKLHLLMEKNVKEYVEILSRKIKCTSRIRDILDSPGSLVYVCHNSRRENLSVILEETVRLNRSTSEEAKTNYHLIVEEYDGETLTYNEAAKIRGLVKGRDLRESNIVLLAQPLTKKRCWNTGKESYERETCMFSNLENTFKIVKLEEVLRCSNKISDVTKSTQNFVRNQDSIFKTEIVEATFKQQQQPQDSRMVSHSLPGSTQLELGTSRNEKAFYPSDDSTKADKSLDLGIDLDQAIQRSATLKKSNARKSKIVSKFGFLCEPRQGVDIEGLKPNVVGFSKGIFITSDIAVISLTVLLKHYIGDNKTTTFLHMADEPPKILRRSIQLLMKLDERFSYTQDMEGYLQENKKSKMIFASNFRSVNGMEFDHVVIIVSQSEYFVQHYLPQAISRCTYDLTIVLLPKEKFDTKERRVQKLRDFFPRSGNKKTKGTVANMIEELKRASLVKQVIVAECKACEENYCYSISNEVDNKETFEMHTHSDQYKKHLENYEELEEQHSLDTNVGPHADARYVA